MGESSPGWPTGWATRSLLSSENPMKRIPLTQGKEALVDDVDYAYLMQWKWYFSNRGYAVRNTRGSQRTTLAMHTVVAKRKGLPGREVDHQDRNRLNNKRSNLREARRQQNLANSGPRRYGTSGYRGVTWRAQSQRYQARIMVDRKAINLGHHDTALKAAKAYNKAASKYFGEFAFQNPV